MNPILASRQEAGKLLALRLTRYANASHTCVIALPRGGVPVGFAIASALHLPLDICMVRKLGVPTSPELAMGAISKLRSPLEAKTELVTLINQQVVNSCGVTPEMIAQVTNKESQELRRREALYLGTSPCLSLLDWRVILVDDGIATGYTVLAAIAALKREHPAEIIITTPIIAPRVSDRLKAEVSQVIALMMPDNLQSISAWYADFTQVTDAEVCHFLGIG